MRFEIPTLDDLLRLLEGLERYPRGALLLVLLILSVAAVVYCWRWAPKGASRTKAKPSKGAVQTLREAFGSMRRAE